MGLDWVEAHGVLYHVDAEFSDVYSITPEGVATWLFDVPTQTGMSGTGGNGICYVRVPERDAEYLYVTDTDGIPSIDMAMVYKFALDGTLLDSWEVGSICDGAFGICFDGTHFWLSSLLEGRIVECTDEFQQVAVYDHPAWSAGGMDHDPASDRYYVTDYVEGSVYVCDGEMNVVDVFRAHPTAACMMGVTIGRTVRGRTLWTASMVTDLVYEIDDEYHDPAGRTSWGTIKGMFR